MSLLRPKFDFAAARAKLDARKAADEAAEAALTPEQRAERLQRQRDYRASQVLRSGLRRRNHV